jgi:hypothetical protein
MHEHASPALQSIFYKPITLREILYKVLIVVVLDVDREMPKRAEKLRV